MAALIPLAHAAHYLWVLYLPPLLIVVVSVLGSKIAERRDKR